ncbi:MAG: hydrogenase maturation protease [Candidatus Eisenbacteria bacterium]|nr:hydrogenase maturation protease [Candidatus Eisenbacteria bacterium]
MIDPRAESSPSDPRSEGLAADRQRVLILGVGNLLLSDEGFGVHAAQRLERESWPPHVRVVEGGTDGFHLMNVITDCDRLIVIDCIKGGGAPGTLYRFDREDAPAGRLPALTSAHQVGMLEVLELQSLIGAVPRTTFIGVEPESIEMGLQLSPRIAARLPRVGALVRELLGLERDATRDA